jgi:creatinine amidohydrolase
MPLRRLADLRAPEVAQAITNTSILVMPVGAIEQHGPHLPLNTDLVIAESIASAAIDRVPPEVDAWLLPSLAVTKSNEHAWSPGTLWLGPETLLAVLRDLGRSVSTMAARKLLLFNGHGGNSGLLGVALRELRLEFGLLTFLAHPSLPADQGGRGNAGERGLGIHGGTEETALMLHLAPESVAMDLAVRRVPEAFADRRHVRFGGPVSFGWLSSDFGAHGVIGDPTTATADHGAELFEEAVTNLVEAIGEIDQFQFESG